MSFRTIDANAAPSRTISCPRDVGRWIAQAVRRRVLIYRTLHELGALSDIELADIGVTRCDINRLAASTAEWQLQRGCTESRPAVTR
jgi:uncharacterized protein YjiS (DUF1127 family)